MANALADVQATYTNLDDQYTMLLAACTSEEQRVELSAKYAQAQDAYNACVEKMLQDDAPEVADLSTQLKAANDQLKKAVAEMGNMSKVLDNLTTAITVGAQLVAKIPV
jgi:molecular chaperone GrpE (heat shock protein)